MDLHTLILILLSVTWSCTASSPRRQYHLVSERKSWTDAQAYCRGAFTDLATVESQEDMDRLTQLAQDRGDGTEVWIGLHGDIDDLDSWKWSLNQSGFYGEGEDAFRDWYEGEPNNYGGYLECCAEIWGTYWNSGPCDRRYAFICYDANSDRYERVEKTMSWTEAQSYCRTHFTDLASVRNSHENQQLIDLTNKGRSWIGLHKDCPPWKWSDQSVSSFRNWSPTSSGEDLCVAADVANGGSWYRRDCENRTQFVCYSVAKVSRMKKVVRVELEAEPQVDMSDPVVQEAILEQMRQRLVEKGLPADTKLRWQQQEDGQVFSKKQDKEEGKRKKRSNDEF